MTAQLHVVVIGGGAAGMTTAYELISKGARVTVLEANALGSGSSGRSVGVVGTQMTDPFQILLRRYAIPRFREWEAKGLIFHHIGYLRLARTEAHMEAVHRSAEMQAAEGFRARVMSPEDMVQLIPHLSVEGLAGGIFGPDDGFIDPYQLCTLLGELVRAQGGQIKQFCKVLEATRKGAGYRLETTKGPIECDVVVNAAGAWAPKVAEMFGQTLHIFPERHEAMSILLDNPLEYTMPMVMDLIEGEGTGLNFRYEKPTELISEIHKVSSPDPEDPDNYNDQCMDSSREYLAELLLERLPELPGARLGRGWAGLYPMTSDGKPFAGPINPDEPTLITAGGGGGYGIQLSPVIGIAAADWVLHGGITTAPGLEALAPTPERNRPLVRKEH
ncbi:FAD-binding oxidoreductase [Chelativorans composti]|uniref:NAD(P)/FAD-dependent oxidoreductase n=1 Tax=Chelativorans composti TaxID=768533 RepID=A0ABW5DMH9_9HYPH